MGLMGKEPLGLKMPKPINGTAECKRHMSAVAKLRCLVCGAWPVEVHHIGKPRSDMRVIPLCPRHHRREFGPDAFHYSERNFYERHGDMKFLLAVVADKLAGEFNE